MSGIDIEGTLSDHFVMLAELEGDGPPHVWRCQCGAKFGFSDSVIAHVAAVLRAQIEGALAEAKRDALANEAEWLHGAHANSHDKGYSAEYRKGFLAAAGWVRFHARMDHLSDTERAGGAG